MEDDSQSCRDMISYGVCLAIKRVGGTYAQIGYDRHEHIDKPFRVTLIWFVTFCDQPAYIQLPRGLKVNMTAMTHDELQISQWPSLFLDHTVLAIKCSHVPCYYKKFI